MASIIVPVRKDPASGQIWAELSAHGPSATHVVCGEHAWQGSDVSIHGGHRVREFKFKKNVHWRIITGFDLDISTAKPPEPPRRQGRRHDKR